MKKVFLILAACAFCLNAGTAEAGDHHHKAERPITTGVSIGFTNNSFTLSFGYAQGLSLYKPEHNKVVVVKERPKPRHDCDCHRKHRKPCEHRRR